MFDLKLIMMCLVYDDVQYKILVFNEKVLFKSAYILRWYVVQFIMEYMYIEEKLIW